jgi:hypothetical protein
LLPSLQFTNSPLAFFIQQQQQQAASAAPQISVENFLGVNAFSPRSELLTQQASRKNDISGTATPNQPDQLSPILPVSQMDGGDSYIQQPPPTLCSILEEDRKRLAAGSPLHLKMMNETEETTHTQNNNAYADLLQKMLSAGMFGLVQQQLQMITPNVD